MKSALKILIFVLIMGTFSGGLLVGINAMTSSLISKNEELKLKTSVLDVLEIPYSKSDILDVFASQVKSVKREGNTFYSAADGSVAFEFKGPGLWGPISGIAAFEKDMKTIRNLKIIHQEETPGLGGRIAERPYLEQFKGKEVFPKLIFVPEGQSRRKNEVDAITGATGSSKALEKLINESVERYIAVPGE